MTIPRRLFDDIEKLVFSGKVQEAWEMLHPYVIDNPNDFDVLHNKATILMFLGNTADALQAFEDALAIDRFNEHCLYNFAACLAQARRHEDSLFQLRQCIALNPNKAKAVMSAGEMCYVMHRYREAADYYRRYMRLYPHKKAEMLPNYIHCLQYAEAQEPDNVYVKLDLYEALNECDKSTRA